MGEKKNNSDIRIVHTYDESNKTVKDILTSDEFINTLYQMVIKYT